MTHAEPVPLDPDGDIAAQLLAAAAARRYLDCGAGSRRATVPAEEVRRACLAVGDDHPFGVRIAHAHITGALDLSATRVAAPLHFVACEFAAPPDFDGADLHELAITDAESSDEVPCGRADASLLPGLLANGVRIRRDLVLSGTVISGAHATTASLTRTSAVWLTEADIGGRLLAVGTKIYTSGDRALQADRARIGGDIRLVRDFLATGEVRMIAVRLGGSLDLATAVLRPGNGRALDLAEAVIGGSVFLLDDPETRVRPHITGRVELGRATIHGRLLVRNADLDGPSKGVGLHDYNAAEPGARVFLLAPRLTVHGEFMVERDTVIRGGLLLHGADLRGGLRMTGGRVRNGGDLAIDLSQATIGATLNLHRTRVEGTVNIANARVAGPLDLRDARLDAPRDGCCLIGIGTRVDGDARLRNLRTSGGSVNFRGATIAGVLDAHAAVLANPGDKTLSLHQAHITGNVRLYNGFRSTGLVVLTRATIEGRLRCDGGTFAWVTGPGSATGGGLAGVGPDAASAPSDADFHEPNVRGCAVEAISAVVGGGIRLGWRVPSGAVDLTDARTTYLADDPATDWPAESYLGGFSYERFAPLHPNGDNGERDAMVRARWLGQQRPYDPRPWEQVARVLRASGDHRGAEDVLIAQRRRARRARREAGGRRWRAWVDWSQDVTVRYGYRPQRALIVLLLLILAVGAALAPASARATMRATDQNGYVYTVAGPQPPVNPAVAAGHCGGGAVRCFNPVLYAIDTVVPIIDLHQRATWYPSRDSGGAWLEWWLNLCTVLGWGASTVFALSFTRLGRPAQS